MGFTLEMLPNEPIMLVTATGMLTIQDFAYMFAESRKILLGLEGPIFRITDFREATSSFMDLIKMSQMASKGNEGTTTDPRIRPILVGTTHWVSIARTIFEQPQYSTMRLPTLETLEDALVFARSQIVKTAIDA